MSVIYLAFGATAVLAECQSVRRLSQSRFVGTSAIRTAKAQTGGSNASCTDVSADSAKLIVGWALTTGVATTRTA
jgi:hypothetical protein